MFGPKNGNAGVSAFTLQQYPAYLFSTAPAPAAAPRPQVVRVALVAGDLALRQLIAQQLSLDPRTQLVAWKRTLREARQFAQDVDVVLVTIDLEDGSGLELLAHLKAAGGNTKAILLTRFDDEEAALQAFELGAAGCLDLDEWAGSFVLPILNVAHGGSALSPSLAWRLIRRSTPIMTRPASPDAKLSSITGREREVLAQVADGLSSKEIARRLAISGETVNAHVKSIYRKLHVHNRAQLVRVASQAGMC